MSSEQYMTIDREELKRLQADSAELARVRETVEIDMPYTLVNVPDSNETRVIGFRISKSDEAYGEMGLSEPLAWFRKWVGHIASSKGRRIPEGFALVPVESSASDVLAERKRQIEVEGWTPEHDDEHSDGRIADEAAGYLLSGQHPLESAWSWKHKHPDSPKRADRRRQLVIGAAMAIAEIDRLDRAAMLAAAPKGDSHE